MIQNSHIYQKPGSLVYLFISSLARSHFDSGAIYYMYIQRTLERRLASHFGQPPLSLLWILRRVYVVTHITKYFSIFELDLQRRYRAAVCEWMEPRSAVDATAWSHITCTRTGRDHALAVTTLYHTANYVVMNSSVPHLRINSEMFTRHLSLLNFVISFSCCYGELSTTI